MSTSGTDLWGELDIETVRTPVALLREQASLLREKTKGLVEATVESTTQGGVFYHSLNLVVPSLENYTYRLLTISHRIELYPVAATLSRKGVEVPVGLQSEDGLLRWLHEQLSSPATKRIIASLAAQAAK